MAKLINIGFGNVVNSRKIVAVVSPDAAPVKRMIQSIKGTRSLIDATQGRKTKAVIVTSDDFLCKKYSSNIIKCCKISNISKIQLGVVI